MSAKIHIVALGGGSGTRFWPVSRRARPKQLLALSRGVTLLQGTFERVRAVSPPERWWMVVGAGHADGCRRAVPEVPAEQVLIEPVGRNTAPAIGLAALHLAHQEPDAIMVVLPADHAVAEPEPFRAALAIATEVVASGGIVTLGVEPTHAESAYGYIECGERHAMDGAYRVSQFLEKPDPERAEQLLALGGFLWNAGIFVMRAATYLRELERHLPRMHTALVELDRAIGTPQYQDELERAYGDIDSISIDYGVMEHTEEVVVVPVACGWSDVGSWNALGAVIGADEAGNRVRGRTVLRDSRGCVVYASEGHVVAAVGMENVVVVHTPDATLVVPVSRAQEVRAVIAELGEKDWSEYL